MDQVVRDRPRAHEGVERFVSAIGKGIIFVDADGKIVWIDEKTRRRVNGGLQNLELPLSRIGRRSIDCFVASVDVMINGEVTPLCIVQEASDQNDKSLDFSAAIEAIMADTSWLTSALVEKFKIWRQSTLPAIPAYELDLLTDREREILGLVCEGRTDEEMGKMLNLSRNTVRNHVASLYRKIGVNRRGTAIIWARERAITRYDMAASKKRTPMRRDRQGAVAKL